MRAAPSFLPKLLRQAGLDRLPLRIALWSGEEFGSDSPKLTLRLRRPSALKHLMRPNAGRLATAYVEEEIDVEGDPRDIVGVGMAFGQVSVRPKLELLRAWHSRARDRKAIRFHYDVSNEFYALWLDRNLVYSCGYFRSESDSLDLAQEQKLHHICRKLCLKPGERFLDIGCGWGGLILWAAEHYGAQCVGITLSERQFEHATRLIRERGLEDRCEVRLMDYRDLDPGEPFDKIASVGMFEHVGRRNLRLYFSQIHDLLVPGGLLLNHGIASSWTAGQDLGSSVGDFIDRYVFPDGELVHIAEASAALAAAGLELRDVEGLRPHYAKTLWHWVERLDCNAEAARRLVGEKAYRIWRIYMAGSAHAFERGWISLYQTLAGRARPDGSLDYPLTREHLYADPATAAAMDAIP